MNNSYKRMKKKRPLSEAEKVGMMNLLSGVKRIRELATQKPVVVQEKAGERIITPYPIP